MENLREAFKNLQSKPTFLMTGIVAERQDDVCTITVTPDNGDSDYNAVRLRSQIDEEGTDPANTGLLVFPKVGSSVTVAFFDDQNAICVGYTQVDKIRLKGANAEIELGCELNTGLSLNLIEGKVIIGLTDQGVNLQTPENVNVECNNFAIANNGNTNLDTDGSIGINAGGGVNVQAGGASSFMTSTGSVNLGTDNGQTHIFGNQGLIFHGGAFNVSTSQEIYLGSSNDLVATAGRLIPIINTLHEKINALTLFVSAHVHTALNVPPTPAVPPLLPNLPVVPQSQIAAPSTFTR